MQLTTCQTAGFYLPCTQKFRHSPTPVGTTQAAAPIERLSDNGSTYIDRRTRTFACELGSPTRILKANVQP
ncbi:hypothetical protein E2553_07140 [Paraburkholderia dipogonis]|uniref:Uncharacterized protein n=1 Tax=Paraburkholderia dipogonis TaxID=1211383 RepID=A0A4Y8N4Y0_9BURK|nr:hypothetical protein E2553_07140 [Paraburkholderia dipogonis]